MSEEKGIFPEYFTIDEIGLDALNYFLKKEFYGETVKIIIEEKND
jgi:hypothetical protein